MQLADRPEFEGLLAQLCVGLGVPPTKHRQDAFWSGLKRMSLSQFRRCVDEGLGESGIEEPTVKAVWRFHRGTERAAAAPVEVKRSEPDHLEYFANRLLFQHIASRGGLGSTATFKPGSKDSMADAKASPELTAALAAKRKLVDEFIGYIREGDELATPAEFIRGFMSVMRRASPLAPEYAKRLREAMEAPGADKPFEPHMARELAPRQAQLA